MRKLLPALRRSSRGAASSLAMALAIAGTATLAAAPAHAQEEAAAAQPTYSEAFGAAYQPVADIVGAEGGDLAAARAQLPAVHAAISTADDRYTGGNLTLVLGNKLQDAALMRQGLEMMLASGKVAPERVGEFQYNLGSLAYDAKDWATAREAIQAAIAAGYQQPDMEGLVAESYFGEGQNAQGLEYLRGVIEQRRAAGQPVPQNWVRRGLAVAYTANLPQEVNQWSAQLVRNEPTQENWKQALQVIVATNDLDDQAQLDLLRLMNETGTLTERPLYEAYVDAADPRIMSNEVARVLEAGLAQGAFTASDPFYADMKRIADERAPVDRREAPELAAEAQASAQGREALNAGDVFLSLEDYAQAEAMYQMAIDKGVQDRDLALTRLGIAQAHQGKGEEAKATFAQVSGARTPVAQMWTAYVDSQA